MTRQTIITRSRVLTPRIRHPALLVLTLLVWVPVWSFVPHLRQTCRRSQLFASTDITEEDYTEDDGNDYVYASPEAFTSEAEIAEAANELASCSKVELQHEVENSFLQYALSIILGRALPDARDGLKPVHRRILYSMSELNLVPTSSHRKCARVVGEVLGKFHPHGDMAVYDALVRMAQDFSTGTPLIDGHGNFGSIDADPAAAMRYTECKLTPVAKDALLEEIHQDTVDFVPNFDGNEMEPVVLPAKLPLLLLNGCSGIAVGMATNVPPHNLKELLTACQALVASRHPGATSLTDQALFEMIPGPDFPTGATIMGTNGAEQLYKTGNGGIVMRATTELERVVVGGKSKKQSRSAIVVTQLPYQVNKAALMEKIALLVNEKKLEGIADLRDESDRDGIRVVIELKRDAVAAVVLNNLFKKTPLQTTFSGNFLALMGGSVPQRFTLRKALDCFLDFRFDTIRRRSAFHLRKVESRAHIVDGLLAALDCVDEVIEMIRSAPDQNDARRALMDGSNKALALSREQADAVLKLQLGQLTRLNKGKLEEERATLEKSQKQLNELMTVDEAVLGEMDKEFEHLITKFGTDRKTQIEQEEGDLSELDLIRNSRSVIVVTRGGYIKRMPLKTFESQRRGTRGKKGTSTDQQSEENEVAHCFTCNDHDALLMVTRKGIAYGLRAYQIPTGGRTAKGTPIPSVLPVQSDDVITTILPVSVFSNDEYIVLATKHGWIKKTPLKAFENLSSRGLTIASLDNGDSLNWCHKCIDSDDILIGSAMGKATRFQADKLRPTGRTSRGVHSMRLEEGDTIADMNVVNGSAVESSNKKCAEYALAVTAHGYGKRVPISEFRTTARGRKGVIAIKFKSNSEKDYLSCLRVVREDDEILLITAKGIMVRTKVRNIPSQSRTATGVMAQKVDVENGDQISSVSLVPKYEERDD